MICGDIYDLITIMACLCGAVRGVNAYHFDLHLKETWRKLSRWNKINKIFNLNHPSDLFLITASSKWIANGHGGSRRPSPLLPGSPVVRTLLAFSWSFSSVSHVRWPQYRPPSLIISAFISTRPMVALTGNLTICIEKLLSCVRWERTVLHNYKWCAAAGPDWRVHVGELGGEWARWWIWCVSVDMKDDHGWNCFSFTRFKVKCFILFPVPSAGFTDKDWNREMQEHDCLRPFFFPVPHFLL